MKIYTSGLKKVQKKRPRVNKSMWVLVAVVAAALGFMQMEIATVHEDVQDIKAYIIKTNHMIKYTPADEDCLARNIYHEAGVESLLGKFAVAQVTINRLREGRYGKTVCKVVYAPAQFSWTLYTKKRNEAPKGQLWTESREVAHAVLAKGYRVAGLEDSTLYHANYIKPPVWAKSVAKIQQIGQHIFYKRA
jgi:spore germination cell wall hydrolase CwlJ-like protein